MRTDKHTMTTYILESPGQQDKLGELKEQLQEVKVQKMLLTRQVAQQEQV